MFRTSSIAVRPADSMLKHYDGPASTYRTNGTLRDLEFRPLHIDLDKVDVIIPFHNIVQQISRH
ncbi:MAG TPA: hypothetical protein VK901_13170 [Nitrospiraceae bacterium]|nr:hypothetical protein [Nitrospiraceae bacterium]